jgi:hypothetical protein
MSSEIARTEKMPIVSGTPESISETRKELVEFVKAHDPVTRLTAYRSALRYVEERDGNHHFFILHLRPAEKLLNVVPFRRDQSQFASEQYLAIEKKLDKARGEEAVLVSVDSVSALKKAYPNYFLDTHAFSKLIEKSTKR